MGRGQDGSKEERLDERRADQKVCPEGDDRDDGQGSRTQGEHRDEPAVFISPSLRHTASRKRTMARVRTAMDSSTASSGPNMRRPKPLSPSRKPRPRKMIGNESGARSTSPDARAETVSTAAIRAKAVSRSAKGTS